jgi:hypothetical protein
MPRVMKGIFLGCDSKPAGEPVPVDVIREGDVWPVCPKTRLAPDPYAFILGGQTVVLVPFVVR